VAPRKCTHFWEKYQILKLPPANPPRVAAAAAKNRDGYSCGRSIIFICRAPACTLHCMDRATDNWQRTWSIFVAFLLGATAVAKLAALAVGTRFLLEVDPVTGLTNHQIVIGSAVVELCLVILLLSPARASTWIHFLPALFGVGVLIYRLVAFTTGVARCPCLGGLFGSNQSLTQFEGRFLTAIAIVLVISYPLCHLAFVTSEYPDASAK
jgi:hypothetical protein